MSKFKFELFLKEIQILGFPCCITSEDLFIDVSLIITNIELILTKLWSFQQFSTSQNRNPNLFSTFFEKRIKFLGFHSVVHVETFPLMHQLLL